MSVSTFVHVVGALLWYHLFNQLRRIAATYVIPIILLIIFGGISILNYTKIDISPSSPISYLNGFYPPPNAVYVIKNDTLRHQFENAVDKYHISFTSSIGNYLNDTMYVVIEDFNETAMELQIQLVYPFDDALNIPTQLFSKGYISMSDTSNDYYGLSRYVLITKNFLRTLMKVKGAPEYHINLNSNEIKLNEAQATFLNVITVLYMNALYLMFFIFILNEMRVDYTLRVTDFFTFQGVSAFYQGFAWIIVQSIMALIYTLIACLIYFFPNKAGYHFIEFSSVPLLFTLMYVGFLECIGFALLCSKFVKTPLTMMVAIVLYVIAWIISFVFNLIHINRLLASLFLFHPAIYANYAFQTYFEGENSGVGAHWSNIATDFNNDDLFTTSLLAILYGILGSFLYIFLALYSYIFNKFSQFIKMHMFRSSKELQMFEDDVISDETHFQNVKCVLKIQNLSKTFSNGVQAISKLNINLYEGQITALLGQNGAGKSTTMNMLVGLESPTSGEAFLNGQDMIENEEIIRKSIGFCPQSNIYLTRLTVKEHLQLICKLKESKFNNDVAISLLSNLNLEDKMHRKVQSLSGGEQRRVSIAMALIAQPSVAILDEPTSAVDPATRRILWKLFTQRSKSGQTILISTHFMEEAEVLSQRAAIISKGHLKAIGSPDYLKSVNGSGYVLSVPAELPDVDYTSVCPNIQCIDEAKGKYRIPKSDVQHIPKLLAQLDEENTVYNISASTIEDVFVRMSEPQEEELNLTLDLTKNVQQDANIMERLHKVIYASFLIDFVSVYMSLKKIIPILLFIIFSLAIQVLTFQLCNINPTSSSVGNNDVSLGLDKYSNPQILISGNGSINDLEEYLISKSYQVEVVQNVSASLTSVANRDMYSYIFHYPFGIEVEANGYNCIFNSKVVFAAPDCALLINNFMLHQASSSFTNITYAQVKHRNSTPYSHSSQEECKKQSTVFTLEFCLTIFILYMAVAEVYKRSTKMPQFLRSNGFNMPLSCFIQFIALLMPIYLIFTCNYILLLSITSLTDTYLGKVLISWIIYFFYSMATAAYIMILSRIFSSSILVLLFVFFIPYLMYTLIIYGANLYNHLPSFKDDNDVNIFLVCLGTILRILPYLFPTAMIGRLKMNFQEHESNSKLFNDTILIFVIQLLIYFLGTIINDSLIFRYIFYLVRSLFQISPKKISDIVAISSSRLYYKYRKYIFRTTLAVNNLNLNVPKQKCYGLLGVNGAGKSTTFELLTGNSRIQQGDISLVGIRLISNPFTIFRYIGYCPQFDALPQQLNSYQLLEIFAQSRGVPKHLHKIYSDYLIGILDLKRHASKAAGTYSGGNKRKLTTAIAFIGFPKVIFLDEATTGIDPITRLKIQNLIETAKLHGSTVLISSHSMEECENSCDEIAIMAKGKIVCQGTGTDLKNEHGRFFVVSIQILTDGDDDSIITVRNLMKTKIVLHDEEYIAGSCIYLYYKISKDSCSLFDLFSELWDLKCRNLINDYSVSQSTLETIFMDIAEQYS